jgi:hypothetical protein
VAFEEKRAWVMLVVSILAYGVYVAVVLSLAGPIVDVGYAAPMVWSIGGAIVVSILVNIGISFVSPSRKDQRDREIGRFGEYVGHSFVVLGAVAALLMALAEIDYFCIANAVYLAFVLSAVLGSVVRIFAYRRGFQPW